MITSTSNPQVKEIMQLQKKSKLRRERGVFVAEGMKMVSEAPAGRIERCWISESFARKHPDFPLPAGVPVQEAADHVFAAMSDTQTPQGILAVIRCAEASLEDLLKAPDPLLMVLENIQDPGNLGTVMRTGEGAGITGIIMSSDCADIYNPKVIRSTMGSIYRVPFCHSADLCGALDRIKETGITVYAAHLKGSQYYTENDYTKPSAFLIGNEGNGLKQEIADRAGTYIKIPMEGHVESLNAAVSAAILMYEAHRQRQ